MDRQRDDTRTTDEVRSETRWKIERPSNLLRLSLHHPGEPPSITPNNHRETHEALSHHRPRENEKVQSENLRGRDCGGASRRERTVSFAQRSGRERERPARDNDPVFLISRTGERKIELEGCRVAWAR